MKITDLITFVLICRFSYLNHLPLLLLVTLPNTLTITLTICTGADIFRLNFSHGEHQQKADLVKIIRAIEKKYDHPIAILADLQVSN